MTKKDFNKLIEAHKLRGAQVKACQWVLVNKKTAYQAAMDTGVDKSLLGRALKKLRRPLCQCCGKPIS